MVRSTDYSGQARVQKDERFYQKIFKGKNKCLKNNLKELCKDVGCQNKSATDISHQAIPTMTGDKLNISFVYKNATLPRFDLAKPGKVEPWKVWKLGIEM